MFQTQILSTGHFTPEKVVTNDDIAKRVDTNDQWITERTGIKERRISDENKEFPSYMAAEAAKEALEKAKMDPNDIDLIMVSNTIGDYNFPNTATVVQERLGITSECPCLDINAACTGWVYGLVVANSLIQTNVYKNILLIGTEMTSRFNNWDDRQTCILFGDGCGATLLTATDKEGPRVIDSVLGCDSSKKDSLILPVGGAVRRGSVEIYQNKEQFVSMDGQTVFKNAVKTMASHCAKILQDNNLTQADIDWFIPHQANQRIIEAVARRLEYPMEKVISNVHKYANTSSASIPIAMNEALKEGKIKRGQKVMFAAFGAGLTSGAALIEF